MAEGPGPSLDEGTIPSPATRIRARSADRGRDQNPPKAGQIRDVYSR
jgi:hypothetical protein